MESDPDFENKKIIQEKITQIYQGFIKEEVLKKGWRVKIKKTLGPDMKEDEEKLMPHAAQIHFLKQKK